MVCVKLNLAPLLSIKPKTFKNFNRIFCIIIAKNIQICIIYEKFLNFCGFYPLVKKIDRFDLKILNHMQDNCRITTEQLSKEIGLSASACQRRINKLREEGVIAREVAILSKEKISPVLTTIVEIALERETPNIMDDFKNSMLTIQEVTQCYYVTGEIDFILILNVRDIDHYQNFTQKFLFDNPNIRRFNTLVVMETVKQRLNFHLKAD